MKLIFLFLSLQFGLYNNFKPSDMKSCQTTMTKKEIINNVFSNDCLKHSKTEVLGFKVKIHKSSTIVVDGNRLNKTALEKIYRNNSKYPITIFDIVYDIDSEDLPKTITIQIKT